MPRTRRPFIKPGEALGYAPTLADLLRFWSKFVVDETTPIVEGSHCWIWQGATDPNGYGQVKLGGRARWIHRVAFALSNREQLDGLDADHLCESRACGCPYHLRAATRSANSSRGARAAGTRSRSMTSRFEE